MNQPARPASVAALRASRTATIPEGQTPVIQRIANWLTARGENDTVIPGEAKKVAAFHKAAAVMHDQAGGAQHSAAAQAHRAAAQAWEKQAMGTGASISAAADSQMAKLINYQDGGLVDGFGRDQLKAANDGINAAKNATPANLRHLYKSGIRSDRHGYIWSWVLKEFPRPGAGASIAADTRTLPGDKIKPQARPSYNSRDTNSSFTAAVQMSAFHKRPIYIVITNRGWVMKFEKPSIAYGQSAFKITATHDGNQFTVQKDDISPKQAGAALPGYTDQGKPPALEEGAKGRRRQIIKARVMRGEKLPAKVLEEFKGEPWVPKDAFTVGASTMPTETKPACGMSRKAAYLSRVAASQGGISAAGGSMTVFEFEDGSAAARFVARANRELDAGAKLIGPSGTNRAQVPSQGGVLAQGVRRLSRELGGTPGSNVRTSISAAVTKRMDHASYQRGLKAKTPDELKYIIKDAREAMQAMPQGPNAGYYQDEIHYAQMELKKRKPAGASISAAFKVGDKVSYPSPNASEPPMRGVIKRIADGRATLVDSLNPGDHRTVPVSMLKPYQAGGKELPFAAGGRPPFAKQPAAPPSAPPPPPEPEPDPADAPLGMSRKAQFVRRMLAKKSGAAPAVPATASIAAAALPPARQGFRQPGDDGSPVWVVVSVQTGKAVSKPVTRAMAEKIKRQLATTGGTYDIERGNRFGAGASIAAASGASVNVSRQQHDAMIDGDSAWMKTVWPKLKKTWGIGGATVTGTPEQIAELKAKMQRNPVEAKPQKPFKLGLQTAGDQLRQKLSQYGISNSEIDDAILEVKEGQSAVATTQRLLRGSNAPDELFQALARNLDAIKRKPAGMASAPPTGRAFKVIRQVLPNDVSAQKEAMRVYNEHGPKEFLNWVRDQYGNVVVEQFQRVGISASIAAASGNREIPINKLQAMAREGKLEYAADPKPNMHVEVRWPSGKKEWVMVRPAKGAGASIAAATDSGESAAWSAIENAMMDLEEAKKQLFKFPGAKYPQAGAKIAESMKQVNVLIGRLRSIGTLN